MGKMKTKMPRAAEEGQDAGAGGEGAGEAAGAKKPTETAAPFSAGGDRDSARKEILLFGA